MKGVLALSISIALLGMATIALSQEIVAPRVSEDWMYIESRPGLRQEGKPVHVVGELLYRSKPMPSNLAKEGVRLSVDIGTFRYGEREDQLSSGGWLLFSDTTVEVAQSGEQAIAPEELALGFYSSVFDKRKKDTPSDWIFVEVDGEEESLYWTQGHLTYWTAPAKLYQLPLE